MPTHTTHLEVNHHSSCLPCHHVTPLVPLWALSQRYSTHVVHSFSSTPCLQGLSAAPQVRPFSLHSPLLSTLGASSYNQLWQDVDLAMVVFQATMRTAVTETAFDVSAALRDALCRGIVSRLPHRPTGGPRSLMRPMGCSPAHRRGAPLAPPSS